MKTQPACEIPLAVCGTFPSSIIFPLIYNPPPSPPKFQLSNHFSIIKSSWPKKSQSVPNQSHFSSFPSPFPEPPNLLPHQLSQAMSDLPTPLAPPGLLKTTHTPTSTTIFAPSAPIPPIPPFSPSFPSFSRLHSRPPPTPPPPHLCLPRPCAALPRASSAPRIYRPAAEHRCIGH